MKKIIYLLFIFSLFTNILQAAVPLDFDGDGKTDFTVYISNSVGGTLVYDWFVAKSSNNSLQHYRWGISNDVLVPEDYDGDNKTDIAIWRTPANGQQGVFYILNSSDLTVRTEYFGTRINDVLDNPTIIGDFDGDHKADIAVYRIVGGNQQNLFIYKGSLNNPNGNLTYIYFGQGFGFAPIKGDFDGDGKLDFCVTNRLGLYVLLRSSDFGVEYINWGQNNDTFLSGDFDGDHKTDFCVVRRNQNNLYEWFILERDGGGTGANPIIWGKTDGTTSIDQFITLGDYDGDGKSDIGMYRIFGQPTNNFLIRKSSDGGLLAYQWGMLGHNAVFTP